MVVKANDEDNVLAIADEVRSLLGEHETIQKRAAEIKERLAVLVVQGGTSARSTQTPVAVSVDFATTKAMSTSGARVRRVKILMDLAKHDRSTAEQIGKRIGESTEAVYQALQDLKRKPTIGGTPVDGPTAGVWTINAAGRARVASMTGER